MEELLLQIDVTCTEPQVVDGHTRKIVMVPFTGTTSGKYFTGKVIGTGVDTQTFPKDKNGNFIEGTCTLSARYILEGTDFTGTPCRIFIENNAGPNGWLPQITTDSKALASWETATLRSSVEPAATPPTAPGQFGVTVKIFKCEK